MGGDLAAEIVSPLARVAVGKYELFAKLGSGGQADVYLGVARGPVGFNKLVVVKRLRGNLADKPVFVEMFLDEARLAARLNHPNIVHTYEVGEHDDGYFIAMEYLEGDSLSKLARSPLSRDVAAATWARIVADALAGLHYAHELADYDGRPLEIVHRDVSPQNLFVSHDGTVKLVDFGVAKASVNNVVTETGALKGKVAYMAPEQVRGDCDRRADLFAMGVVLWELLARRRLFEGEPVSVLHRLMSETGPITPLTTVKPDVDPALAAIVARALERDPGRRYATAAQMRGDLETWLATAGDAGRAQAVAHAMFTAFGATKDSVRQRVQEAMSGRGSLSRTSAKSVVASGAGLGVPPAGSWRGPGARVDTAVLPVPQPMSLPPEPMVLADHSLASVQMRAAPVSTRKRTALVVASGAALALVMLVSGWGLGRRLATHPEGPLVASPAVAPPKVEPAPAPAPPKPAPVAVAEPSEPQPEPKVEAKVEPKAEAKPDTKVPETKGPTTTARRNSGRPTGPGPKIAVVSMPQTPPAPPSRSTSKIRVIDDDRKGIEVIGE